MRPEHGDSSLPGSSTVHPVVRTPALQQTGNTPLTTILAKDHFAIVPLGEHKSLCPNFSPSAGEPEETELSLSRVQTLWKTVWHLSQSEVSHKAAILPDNYLKEIETQFQKEISRQNTP